MGGSRRHLDVRRFLGILAVAVALWAVAAVGCLFFGQVRMAPGHVVDILLGRVRDATAADIVRAQRAPRVLLGLLAGGGLAVAGAVFQALLRNPLATPHTLGVSAGGALGAVVALSFGWTAPALGPVGPVQVAALLGSTAVIGVIYLLGRSRRALSPLKLLLAGVTLGLISSAMIMLVRFVSDPQELVMVDRWLMGGLDVHGFRNVAALVPFLLPALVLLVGEAGALNQLALGEEMAAGRGVDVEGTRVRAFLAGSVLTAAVVSVAGPIGFVGLIVPHMLRLLLGPDHRLVLPVSFLGGGAFLVLADTVARTTFAPSELPVGVLTAVLGGPFFLFLLVRGQRC